jgi:hypothetical protein
LTTTNSNKTYVNNLFLQNNDFMNINIDSKIKNSVHNNLFTFSNLNDKNITFESFDEDEENS